MRLMRMALMTAGIATALYLKNKNRRLLEAGSRSSLDHIASRFSLDADEQAHGDLLSPGPANDPEVVKPGVREFSRVV